MSFFYFYTFEWLFLVCSLVTLQPKNQPYLRLLFAIALITVLAETVGYLLKNVWQQANHLVYNFSVPTIILLFILFFRLQLNHKSNKQLLLWLTITYCLFIPINLIWIQGWQYFATYQYIAGALVLSMAAMMFLVELIKKPIPTSLITQPSFFTAAAVLIMYIPKSCLYAFFAYLSYIEQVSESFAATFQVTNLVLCIIFYILLSIACLCPLLFKASKMQ
ncbi:MAG: hypothetical protein ACOVNR_05385 [Chitinophagaceae bacterium]